MAIATEKSLPDLSSDFDAGMKDKKAALDTALENLTKDPSTPKVLAEYQSKLSEYTLYRNAQSSVVKALKDVDAAIIQNFR